jgi:hypothetical protein
MAMTIVLRMIGIFGERCQRQTSRDAGSFTLLVTAG